MLATNVNTYIFKKLWRLMLANIVFRNAGNLLLAIRVFSDAGDKYKQFKL